MQAPDKASGRDRNKFRFTALMMAAANGHTAIVRDLIQKGAEVGARNDRGNVALIDAARFGHTETVRLLLDYGAEINARDNGRNSALTIHARDTAGSCYQRP